MKNLIKLKTSKKILTGIMSVLFLGISFAFAEKPDTFILTVDPETFETNESVDVTIKAIKNDWTVIKDYQGTVMIEFEESLEDDIAELPADLYMFSAEDQWVRTWSKWLKIREKWNYTLRVYDLEDDNIAWEQLLIVWDWGNNSENLKWTAEIISPISGETVTTQDLNILWKSDITNTTVAFFLNWMQIEQEAKSDINWNFNIYIKEVKKWENKLFVRLIGINSEVLAQSEEISFNYEPVSFDDKIKWLTVSPSKDINLWDEIKFDIEVWDNISNAELKVWDWWDLIWIFPMEKIDNTHFTKTLTIDNDWQHSVSVTLIMKWWERKSYNVIDTIKVSSDRTKPSDWNSNNWNDNSKSIISNLKVVRDSVIRSKINVSWDASGNPYSYEIRYWTERWNLTNTKNTSAKQITIWDLDNNSEYYFQIIPLDNENKSIWQPSTIVGTIVWQNWTAWEWNCSVGWIAVSTVNIWNQHYLTRGTVPWASKYIVSRSDSPSNFQKVWETADTKYAYPFNPNIEAKSVYYSVTAVCNDWKKVQIGWAKKVVVWPAENIMIILWISIFGYLGYKKFIRV